MVAGRGAASDVLWLSDQHLARIAPFCPLADGVPRVDDRRLVSRIIRVHEHKAAALLDHLPRARTLIADQGYDSDASRPALIGKGIDPCIPPLEHRKVQHGYDTTLCRQRHQIENFFGRIKDGRRVYARYERCAHTLMSATALAATFLFWLNQ